MRNKRELPKIKEEDKESLAEIADNLFTYLLESQALSDPSEAQVIAASFIVEQYGEGWKFVKRPKSEESSKEDKQNDS